MSQILNPFFKRTSSAAIFSRYTFEILCIKNKQQLSQPHQRLSLLLVGQNATNQTHPNPHKATVGSTVVLKKKNEMTAPTCTYVSKKSYPFPELQEADLEESFVRGSGPGGQSVNQTANCVVLKHKPSGLVVKCHETRSLEKNRQRARERLRERLDLHLNGDNSFRALQEQESSVRRKEKKKKNKLRLELKKAFKEREGIE